MNAVEAVEQLGALGRKLQAREVGLQQPSLRLQAALRQGAAWEKVLGDPLTVLSQVLGAAGGGQVRVKDGEGAPETSVSSLPLAPFRWEENRPPAGSGIPAAHSASDGGQSGAPPPAGGVRLARRQTSLLGILNANLEDRAYVQVGDLGGVTGLTNEVRSADCPAARDASPAALRGPLAGWSAVPAEPSGGALPAPFAGHDEVRLPGGQATRPSGGLQPEEVEAWDGDAALLTGQGVVSDWPDGGRRAAEEAVEPGLTGDATAGANVWGYESQPQHEPERAVRSDGRRESVDGRVDGLHSGMPAARDEDLGSSTVAIDKQARIERQADEWTSWQQNAHVAPAAQDGAWATADDAQGERPLSMAQIEQVLAVLDERLELGLLRMYGAAGGLP